MEITIKTPSSETCFRMAQEKADELLRLASQYAGEWNENAVPSETEPAATAQEQAPATTPTAVGKPHSKVESTSGYKGFLLLQCQSCGRLYGFCAKTPISEHICKCGERTQLHDLKTLHLNCECGKYFRYKTNATDKMIEYPCLVCGNPVALILNKRGSAYVTIADKDDE